MFNFFKKCDHRWIVNHYYDASFCDDLTTFLKIYKYCSLCGKRKMLYERLVYRYSQQTQHKLASYLIALKAQNPDYYVMGIDNLNDKFYKK